MADDNGAISADAGEDRIYRESVIWAYHQSMLECALERGGYSMPEGDMMEGLRERVADALADASQEMHEAVAICLESLEADGLLERA